MIHYELLYVLGLVYVYMNGREQQLLISMIEDAYIDENHTSFAATVYSITNGFVISSDERLYRILKQEYGIQPTGRISRVVSKRVYDSCDSKNEEVVDTIKSIAEDLDMSAREISDDLLCRQLE